jgi:hypothetical protein
VARVHLLFVAFASALALLACDAALNVLASGDPGAGDPDSSTTDAADDGRPGDARADAGADADADDDDGWPGPSGTVAIVASGLVGAESIDVDDGYVYVALSDIDAGVVRVAKRGGAAESVFATSYAASVRSTPRGVVWAAPYGTPAGVWSLPRDGGAPVALTTGNAKVLAVDGNRVAFATGGSVMFADLDKGSARPIADDQLSVGGLAIDGDRLVWTAKCVGFECNAFVMTSPIAVPAPVQVWARTPTTSASMGGIVLDKGTIAFSYQSAQGNVFARFPPGTGVPVDFSGKTSVASGLRRDGAHVAYLTSAGSSLTLTRRAIDGSGAPAELATTSGSTGAVAPDTHVLYWVSKEEGVLRAIAR